MFSFLFVILLIDTTLGDIAEEINTTLTNIDDKLGLNVSETQTPNRSTIIAHTELFIVSTTEPPPQNVHIVKADVEIDKNNTLYKKAKGNDEFRPSPEVKEVAYERNIFPVKPAYPEAKHSNFNNEDEQFSRPLSQWGRPDETPWNVNFRFPEAKIPTSKDRPYKFEENRGRTYGFSGKNDYETASQKPLINLGAKIPISSSGSGTGLGSSWDLGAGYPYNINKYLPKKPEYDYGVYIEKPPTGVGHHGGHDYPAKKYDSPWKKIIKILAAFIPIGLLISALTPTIITISPVNNTMLRSRDEDPHSSTIKKLMSTLGYFDQLNDKDCENRLLCELLLSASSSQNAEQHIENFLNNFSDRRKYTAEREEELKTIFHAVKRRRCDDIICKGIRENT
ncbi:uncharacterized protein LOC123310080 [Coccinella septempunctata]|uniref:uncharacterized protein LOC123310080 n=1 Tax=Coccinella septempunctata TaxID=41139 RepID=UPI001D094714|nr:uncharacterized protein LOC123310080 [Coccinella septempunctata]